MTDRETFSIIFCSRSSNVINNSNLNSVSYNVSWSAILPKKYKKFECQFIFKSETSTTLLTANGFVSMNLGRMNIFNGNGVTQNIGIIYPVVLSGNNSFYNSTNNDNNNFFIDYPLDSIITITLNQFDGKTAMPNMQNYTLILNLVGILANDDKSGNILSTTLKL